MHFFRNLFFIFIIRIKYIHIFSSFFETSLPPTCINSYRTNAQWNLAKSNIIELSPLHMQITAILKSL